jgi:peptidoglycan/xylan/chitin deacetylase (PgdA/CDA1 family)
MAIRRLFALPALLLATACADAPHEDDHDDLDPEAAAEAYGQAWQGKDETKADGQQCTGVRVPDRGTFGKRIALTFDDGPNPATTPQVVEILRRRGVPATFFINGSRVRDDATRAILADVAADPNFLVGNHSWSHQNMAQLSTSKVASEMDRTTEVMRAAGVSPKWYRFPFGSSNCTTAQMARDRGYIITGWHVDSADWCFASGGGSCPSRIFRYVDDRFRNDMAGLVMQQARSYGGGVALFHDIHQNTADAIEGIIDQLEAEGFTFVRLDDTAVFPQLNGQAPAPPPPPPPPSAFVGDACEGDEDCDFTDRDGNRGFCHGVGFCSLPCEGFCPDMTGKAPTFCVADTGVEPATGICVSKSVDANGNCADVPGTIDASADRFIGNSSAAARSAEVCLPSPQ